MKILLIPILAILSLISTTIVLAAVTIDANYQVAAFMQADVSTHKTIPTALKAPSVGGASISFQGEGKAGSLELHDVGNWRDGSGPPGASTDLLRPFNRILTAANKKGSKTKPVKPTPRYLDP